MGMRATVVLFDIDGTLITCGGAGRQAVKAAFLEVCGRDDVCDFPFDGATDRGIARRGLLSAGMEPTEDAIDALLACYLRHLPGAIERSTRYAVLPGVPALLDALRDHEERPRLLDAGASRGAARLGVARDACRVVIVGDTPKDIAAAHAIGAECVAVATGSHGRADLAGATTVLEDLTDPAALSILLS